MMGVGSSGFGPATITWEALGEWTRLMQQELEPWEASTLIVLGQLHASALSKTPPSKTPPTGKK